MLRSLASAAALVILASPAVATQARAETWHVMGATPAELLMMETDSRYTHANGDVSVWTSSVRVGEPDEPVVKALWRVSCKGEPRIRPRMVIWYDRELRSKESWSATREDSFQPVAPGSRGELTWQYACGRKSWPIAVSGSFGEVTGAYANALAKLVDAASEVAAR